MANRDWTPRADGSDRHHDQQPDEYRSDEYRPDEYRPEHYQRDDHPRDEYASLQTYPPRPEPPARTPFPRAGSYRPTTEPTAAYSSVPVFSPPPPVTEPVPGAYRSNIPRSRRELDRSVDDRGYDAYGSDPYGSDGFAAPAPDRRTIAEVGRAPTQPVPHGRTFEDDDRDYATVMWWTLIWYAVPGLAYAVWLVLQRSTPPAGCTSVTGGVCAAPRTTAIEAVVHNGVGIFAAIVVSFAAAAAIRVVTRAWRAITVGFAGTVVGAGFVTLVITLLR